MIQARQDTGNQQNVPFAFHFRTIEPDVSIAIKWCIPVEIGVEGQIERPWEDARAELPFIGFREKPQPSRSVTLS